MDSVGVRRRWPVHRTLGRPQRDLAQSLCRRQPPRLLPRGTSAVPTRPRAGNRTGRHRRRPRGRCGSSHYRHGMGTAFLVRSSPARQWPPRRLVRDARACGVLADPARSVPAPGTLARLTGCGRRRDPRGRAPRVHTSSRGIRDLLRTALCSSPKRLEQWPRPYDPNLRRARLPL